MHELQVGQTTEKKELHSLVFKALEIVTAYKVCCLAGWLYLGVAHHHCRRTTRRRFLRCKSTREISVLNKLAFGA